MGLAPAPINAWFLAWVALVPLWVLLVKSPERPQEFPGNGWKLSLPSPWLAGLWGLGYHGLALSWITGLHPLTWMGIPWLGSIAIALFAWGFITLWGMALVIFWSWGLGRWGKGRGALFRVLLGTALWCGLEAIWEMGPLYWTSLSYTQSPGNLAILHLGQLSGALTVTAAIVAVNGLIAEAWLSLHRSEERSQPTPSLAMGAIALFLTFHLLGYFLYSRPLADNPNSAFRVGIVQGNIPTREKLLPDGIQRAIEAYTQGYNTLADQGAEAVLTPEGAMPFLWEGVNRIHNPFYQRVVQKGVTVWLGTFMPQGDRYTQSLLTITGHGETVSRFNKIKLVPLGEYIPFEGVLGAIVNRLSPLGASMVPGTDDQIFNTPFGRAAVGICYESAYGRLFRLQVAQGGEFLLTASNLDPYSWVLMAQDQAQGVMRAIETDRWAARATNTGQSSIVDPHGRIRWLSGINRFETHVDTLYRRQTRTPYVRWGNWLTPLLLISAAFVRGLQFWGNR